MTDLPEIVRERLRAKHPADHPDPNLLSAFTERALPDYERAHVLEHLALCRDCRDIVALTAPLVESSTAKETGRPLGVPWFAWPALRWGALTACLVIVGSAVLQHHTLNQPSLSVAKRVAAPAPSQVEKGQAEDASLNDAGRLTALARSPNEGTSAVVKPKSDVGAAGRTRTATSSLYPLPSLTARSTPAAPAFSPQPVNPLNRDAARSSAFQADAATKLERSGAIPPAEALSNAIAPQQMVASSQSEPVRIEAPGKAKAAVAPAGGTVNAPASSSPPRAETPAYGLIAGRARKELTFPSRPDISRWTISSDGQLQHSIDSGRTWQPVAVAEKATFRALSANGPDIWAGGTAGLLYHSTDAGGQWTRVKPMTGDIKLTADIAAIEFTDLRHGKVTTASGEVWLTADGGQTWQVRP